MEWDELVYKNQVIPQNRVQSQGTYIQNLQNPEVHLTLNCKQNTFAILYLIVNLSYK